MLTKIARPFVAMGQKVGSGIMNIGSKMGQYIRPIIDKLYHSIAGWKSAGDGLARGMVGKEKIIEDVAELIGGTYIP